MVVRQKKDGIPPVVLYCAAGGLAAFVTVVFAVRSVLIKDPTPHCSARYARANVLPYSTSNGKLRQILDVQAELLERDWGLDANGRLLKVSGGPEHAALEVRMPAGGNAGGTSDNPVSGVGFKWMPSFLRKTTSACVTYNVWVPEDFPRKGSGVLPGLFGGDPKDAAQPYFAVRLRWLENGGIGYHLIGTKRRRAVQRPLADGRLKLPRGRWVSFAEEVKLNTPGKSDGVLRVWVDDQLQLEREDLSYREDGKLGFTGVRADTHFVQPGTVSWAPAPKSTRLLMTPLIVRW
jgi:Polysaccharide lyase 14